MQSDTTGARNPAFVAAVNAAVNAKMAAKDAARKSWMDSQENSEIRFLRLPQVLELVGLSRSTVYQKISSGTFPKPVPLSSSAIGFVSAEIHEWLAARIAERDSTFATR